MADYALNPDYFPWTEMVKQMAAQDNILPDEFIRNIARLGTYRCSLSVRFLPKGPKVLLCIGENPNSLIAAMCSRVP